MKERQSKGRKVEGEEGKFLGIAASESTDACNVYSSVSSQSTCIKIFCIKV
jgi:hypothetical protein